MDITPISYEMTCSPPKRRKTILKQLLGGKHQLELGKTIKEPV
jgi:hypothetical protein